MASPFTPATIPSAGVSPPVEIIGTAPGSLQLYVEGATAQTNDIFGAVSHGGQGIYVGAGGQVSIAPDAGQVSLAVAAGDAANDPLNVTSALGAIVMRVDVSGAIATRAHAAPADAAIASGECYLWFDQTDGAGNTKLMVKGKSANGTVKTATILLA